LTDPLKPSFFTGALSYKQLSAANIGLSKGGSYDKIKLTGGRLIEGDFKVSILYKSLLTLAGKVTN